MSTQQHHHRVGFGWDEPEQKHIAAAAVVALENRLAERTVLVQRHFLGLGTDQVVDDVTEIYTHNTS